MIFTGYVFSSAAAISPYLEHPKSGPTSQFCSDLAKRLQCYVVAGYPERLSDGEDRRGFEVGANSAVLYDPDGEWIHGYRKTNLFETDLSWAKAGPGFTTFHLPPPLSTVTLAICNDLNALATSDWTLEHGPFELAEYTAATKSNILVLLNAWIDSGRNDDSDEDWHTLNYWAIRLKPLWSPSSEGSKDGHESVVIVCNRTGEENGKTFAGSSAMFRMRRDAGKPRLLDAMGREEEGIRVWNILV